MNLIENNNKQNAILNAIANLDVDKSQEKPIQQVKWNPEEVSEKQVDKAVKSISKDLKTTEDSVKSALEKDPKDLTNEIKDFKNSDNNKKLRDSYLGQRAVDNNKFGYETDARTNYDWFIPGKYTKSEVEQALESYLQDFMDVLDKGDVTDDDIKDLAASFYDMQSVYETLSEYYKDNYYPDGYMKNSIDRIQRMSEKLSKTRDTEKIKSELEEVAKTYGIKLKNVKSKDIKPDKRDSSETLIDIVASPMNAAQIKEWADNHGYTEEQVLQAYKANGYKTTNIEYEYHPERRPKKEEPELKSDKTENAQTKKEKPTIQEIIESGASLNEINKFAQENGIDQKEVDKALKAKGLLTQEEIDKEQERLNKSNDSREKQELLELRKNPVVDAFIKQFKPFVTQAFIDQDLGPLYEVEQEIKDKNEANKEKYKISKESVKEGKKALNEAEKADVLKDYKKTTRKIKNFENQLESLENSKSVYQEAIHSGKSEKEALELEEKAENDLKEKLDSLYLHQEELTESYNAAQDVVKEKQDILNELKDIKTDRKENLQESRKEYAQDFFKKLKMNMPAIGNYSYFLLDKLGNALINASMVARGGKPTQKNEWSKVTDMQVENFKNRWDSNMFNSLDDYQKSALLVEGKLGITDANELWKALNPSQRDIVEAMQGLDFAKNKNEYIQNIQSAINELRSQKQNLANSIKELREDGGINAYNNALKSLGSFYGLKTVSENRTDSEGKTLTEGKNSGFNVGGNVGGNSNIRILKGEFALNGGYNRSTSNQEEIDARTQTGTNAAIDEFGLSKADDFLKLANSQKAEARKAIEKLVNAIEAQIADIEKDIEYFEEMKNVANNIGNVSLTKPNNSVFAKASEEAIEKAIKKGIEKALEGGE